MTLAGYAAKKADRKFTADEVHAMNFAEKVAFQDFRRDSYSAHTEAELGQMVACFTGSKKAREIVWPAYVEYIKFLDEAYCVETFSKRGIVAA